VTVAAVVSVAFLSRFVLYSSGTSRMQESRK